MKPHASIIIPTYNGGPMLRECVKQCLNQEADFDYEVVIVDSSSSDGSLEFLDSFVADKVPVTVKTIPQSDFGHGRTRNLGASIARGELLCFLTQDAIPADSHWLANLCNAMASHPGAAGAFGRHKAHPWHSKYLDHILNIHFSGFGEGVVVQKMDSLERYEADESYRQKLRFYSDNNSCMRRSVWEQHPYPDVEFGEDQIWADMIVRAGYSKLYVNEAVVFHSHEYGLRASFERAKEEAVFFRTHFDTIIRDRFRTIPMTAYRLTRDEIAFFQGSDFPKPNSMNRGLLLMRNAAKLLGHYAGSR